MGCHCATIQVFQFVLVSYRTTSHLAAARCTGKMDHF
jgi:hypothetical protein